MPAGGGPLDSLGGKTNPPRLYMVCRRTVEPQQCRDDDDDDAVEASTTVGEKETMATAVVSSR